MNELIKKSDLEYFLDIYESSIKEEIKNNPNRPELNEKLKTVKNIRHRILVLSKGGLKVINKQGD